MSGARRIDQIQDNQILVRKFVEKRKAKIRAKQLKQQRTEEELSFTSINRDLDLLRAVFRGLIDQGKASRNPVRLVSKFEEVKKEVILSPEDEEKLFEAIEKLDKRSDHVRDILTLLLYSGCRTGEVLKLHKDWINLGKSAIIIPRHSQKRKREPKRVPLNSKTRPIVERLYREAGESGYLIVNPRTGEPFGSIQTVWLRLLREAKLGGKPGVSRLRLHDLRHSFATRLAEKKDISVVKELLGHSNVQTTLRYVHRSDEDLAEASESVVGVPSIFTTGSKNAVTLKIVKGEN